MGWRKCLASRRLWTSGTSPTYHAEGLPTVECGDRAPAAVDQRRCGQRGWDRSHARCSSTQRVNRKVPVPKATVLSDTKARMMLDGHGHDTQIAPQLTERNLERFKALAADKGYDDQSYRKWLRACGKRPSRKHREFAPHDKAANARMDEKLYHRRKGLSPKSLPLDGGGKGGGESSPSHQLPPARGGRSGFLSHREQRLQDKPSVQSGGDDNLGAEAQAGGWSEQPDVVGAIPVNHAICPL